MKVVIQVTHNFTGSVNNLKQERRKKKRLIGDGGNPTHVLFVGQ